MCGAAHMADLRARRNSRVVSTAARIAARRARVHCWNMVDAVLIAKLAKPGLGLALTYAKKRLSPNERMREAWAERIDEFVVEHSQAIASAGSRLALVEARLEEAEAEAAFLNYAEEAMREAVAERRKMLAHAAAAILGVQALTLAEHSKVQRMLRILDPADVVFLRRLALTCGTFFEQQDRKHPDRVRRLMLERSDSRDALSGTFVEEYSTNTWDENEKARLTRFGKKVLLVMKTISPASPWRPTFPAANTSLAAEMKLLRGPCSRGASAS